MHDWLVSIGTGKSQEPLINAGKINGYKILGIDRSLNKSIIDEGLNISTYDHEKALEAVNKFIYKENIKGVISRVSGPACITAVLIAESLGLPNVKMQIAKASTSKSSLTKLAKINGIKTINSIKIKHPIDIKEQEFDFVIKPDQPVCGKKNVYHVHTIKKYKEAFGAASKESLNDYVILQEFIDGRDIGLMIAVFEGKILWNFFYEEHVKEINQKFYGNGVSAPVEDLDIQFEKNMLLSAKAILKNSKPTGFIFFSFRMTSNGNSYLYEINPGLCGDKIADTLLKKIWPKLDFFIFDVYLALGIKPNLPNLKNNIDKIRVT